MRTHEHSIAYKCEHVYACLSMCKLVLLVWRLRACGLYPCVPSYVCSCVHLTTVPLMAESCITLVSLFSARHQRNDLCRVSLNRLSFIHSSLASRVRLCACVHAHVCRPRPYRWTVLTGLYPVIKTKVRLIREVQGHVIRPVPINPEMVLWWRKT